MNARTLCFCIVAIVAVLALVVLFYVARGPAFTGAVSTGICPPNSAPIISGDVYVQEIRDFARLGYRCFFGYDGVTVCCERTAGCCLPTRG